MGVVLCHSKNEEGNKDMKKAVVAVVVGLSLVLTLRTNAFTGGSLIIGHPYDAVRDFSISKNPAGPWSYGCSSSATEADFEAFTDVKAASSKNPVSKKLESWCGNKGSSDGAPTVTHSMASETIRYYSLAFSPNCLGLVPGPQGHRAIVRFTAPGRGMYKVQGTFKALDQTTTDPHVLVNGKETASIKPINNGNHRQDFSFTQPFEKDDTIDFAVGNGGNGNASDCTGLAVTVTPVSGMAAPPVAPVTLAAKKAPELAMLVARYGRQFKTIAANAEELIKQRKTEYVAVLGEAEKSATSRGNLDEVLAVRGEIARVNKGIPPTDAEKAALPDAISKGRSQYEHGLSRVMSALREKQAQVQKQYLTELEALERQLTQRGNIEGAMEVRRESKEVSKRVSP